MLGVRLTQSSIWSKWRYLYFLNIPSLPIVLQMLVMNIWMGEFPWYCKCYITSSYYAIGWPWLYIIWILTIFPSLGRAILKIKYLFCIETGTGLKHGREQNGKWTRKWTQKGSCITEKPPSFSEVVRATAEEVGHLCCARDCALDSIWFRTCNCMFYIPTSTALFPCQYGLGPRVNKPT